MNKYIIALIFSIFSTLTLSAQSKKAYLLEAEKALIKENYYAALTYFNEALEFDEKDVEVILKSADAARKFNAYDIAATRYSYLLDSVNYTSDSTMLIHAAEMYQRLGKYDKATEYLDRYVSEYGTDDDPWTKKAKSRKEAAVWASSRIKEVDETVEVSKIEGDINTAYSDFSANRFGDTIVYASMKYNDPKAKDIAPPKYAKIQEYKNGTSSKVEATLNNDSRDVSNPSFSPDKTRVFYTVCDYINANDLRCDIYQANIKPDGTFTDERKLPTVINDSTATNTHPFVALDPNTGNEILYFVSNRKGGKGNMDLWYSQHDPKFGFAKPINISSLNTEDNEVTPFFNMETNILYFSCDGRQTLGGYDVFESNYNGGGYGEPSPLPAPVNSSYHDIYYRMDKGGNGALLSSNREGATYVDELLKACCFDIYEAKITPVVIDLNALTFDKSSGGELLGATVKLYDAVTGNLIGELTPGDTHEHKFNLDRNKEYLVIATKEGFVPDSATVSTVNIKKSQEIIEKLYLETDGVVLDVFTFDAKTREALNGATIVLEDLTDPTNPQIIKINNEGNNFQFKLDKDKTYRITAKKNGYTSVSEIIDTRGISGRIKHDLFLDKFDLGAYLPIALYFDNDEPDPDSKSTATNKIFGDLIDAYMTRKETYMEKYGRGAKSDVRNESIDRMEDFFEGDVRGGYDQFKIFMDGLISELQSGKRIEMTIRGYASPRFDLKYNLVLAQRRINCVRADMERYAGGVLAPYLKSKQLVITEISYGEELSPVEVSDNITDEKASIYSLRASKQRKVEVISVISK